MAALKSLVKNKTHIWVPSYFKDEQIDKFYAEQKDARADMFISAGKSLAEGIVDEENRIIQGMASTKENDRTDDQVEPAAFNEAFQFYMNDSAVMLYNHNRSNPIGKFLSGEITTNGLFVQGQVSKSERNQLAHDVWDYVLEGTINHFSISFIPKRIEFVSPDGGEVDPWTAIRVIKELELLEISLVTIPANSAARFGNKKGITVFYHRAPGALSKHFSESAGTLALPKSVFMTREQARAWVADNSISGFNTVDMQEEGDSFVFKSMSEGKDIVSKRITFDGDTFEMNDTASIVPSGSTDDMNAEYVHKAFETLLCSSAFDPKNQIHLDGFNKLVAKAMELGITFPECKKYEKIDLRQKLNDKAYEYLPVINSEGYLMVWDNTTKSFTRFNDLARFVRKHLWSTDLFENLLVKQDQSGKFAWNDEVSKLLAVPSADGESIADGVCVILKEIDSPTKEKHADIVEKFSKRLAEKMGIDIVSVPDTTKDNKPPADGSADNGGELGKTISLLREQLKEMSDQVKALAPTDSILSKVTKEFRSELENRRRLGDA